MSRLWSGWRSGLIIMNPATVVRWHRQGFKLDWRWKSRGDPGRLAAARETRDLITDVQSQPVVGAPRIHGSDRKHQARVSR